MNSVPFIHQSCRNSVYPKSNINRFTVPDRFVRWSVEYPEYTPIFYESPKIHGKPYADPAIDAINFHPKWNSIDGDVDRTSFHGEYEIRNKYPLNVAGRTGIIGRGLLGRWGVSHAADCIVTRWKRNDNGTIVKDTSTKMNILQLVAIQHRDSSVWAFPGGFVDKNEKAIDAVKREFVEEALNSKKVPEVDAFFSQNRTKIYTGYVDDSRNTDNAWIETTAYNFHDYSGEIFKNVLLEAGDDAANVKWLDLDRSVDLHASHKYIVSEVTKHLDAHW
ncbi:ADP-ribose pyrophosphatase, mitochondrial-like isoform X2 [Sitodiplosis mosellana]|nr:ADP-ribose pyrophosphatase, mitochondrial-like isoform X2 [Sitodiplosis mosellana]